MEMRWKDWLTRSEEEIVDTKKAKDERCTAFKAPNWLKPDYKTCLNPGRTGLYRWTLVMTPKKNLSLLS